MNNPSLDSFHGAISIWTWKLLSTIFLTMGETKRTENKAGGRCQASFFIVEFCKLKHFFV